MANPLEVFIERDRIVFLGPAIVLLRTKAEVANAIGSQNVHTIDGSSFYVGKAFADRLIRFLPEANLAASEILASTNAHRKARQEVLRVIEENDLGNVGANWETVLDAHQKTAVHAMTVEGLRGLCLFDEQGSGKTVMTLAAFDLLYETGEVELMVVVCPKSMLSEWLKDADRLMPNRYQFAVVEGDATERRAAVLGEAKVLVLGYEAVDSILTPLKAVCEARKTLLVADESFYAKNPEAVRSRAVRELRRYCRRAFVLCGTPAPNGAVDLVHQFDLADDGNTFSDVAVENPVAVRRAVESRGTFIRRLKQETLPHLPPKEFHLIRATMTGRQAQLYREVRDDLSVWLKGMDNRSFQKQYTDYLARRLALLQICACPSEVDALFAGPHAKLEAVDKLLGRLVVEQGQKVVLWSFYRASLEELLERYAKFGAVLVDGSVPGPDRQSAVSRFQTDSSIRLFVGNPAACGAGITLTSSADAVYVSLSNQAAHFLQSLDRIHRRGQTADEVNYHLVVCEDTIEEAEIARLRHKEIAQGDLLGDPDQGTISLDEALAELSEHPLLHQKNDGVSVGFRPQFTRGLRWFAGRASPPHTFLPRLSG